MTKYYLPITALAVFVFMPACKTTSKDIVEIKFNLPKGSKYEYAMNMEMTMNQKMMDKDVDVKNSMGFTYLFEVAGDSAGWKTLSSTITKLSMDMNSMGQTMHFDTESPADTTGPMAIMSKVFGAMKGAQFFFTLNDKGEVGEVRGVKEMQEKMVADLPNSAQIIQGLKGSFDDESLRENMQQAFAAYPGKPVKPGDSWSKSMTQKTQGMHVKFDNIYTLESVNGNDAVIKLVCKLSSPTGTINDTEMNMTGTSEGKTHYDLETGMTTSGNVDMKMNMKVKTGEMEIPMSMDMKMTTKGKKI